MTQKGASQESLSSVDTEIAGLIDSDLGRQNSHIHLIASENFASKAVMEASGSILTNKYSEGFPGRRYYEGCEVVDEIEQLAIDRACELFEADHANVQPHSGSSANMAVYLSLLESDPREHGDQRRRRPPEARHQPGPRALEGAVAAVRLVEKQQRRGI